MTWGDSPDIEVNLCSNCYDKPAQRSSTVLVTLNDPMMNIQEYLPLLNKYKAMPESYMKYSIDKHLKRWKSALANIAK